MCEVHAGAGGTDAQDWTEVLLRMYQRWAERRGFTVEVDEATEGQEAGLLSATFIVHGRFAYGLLATERGVHRLVRMSPFDSQHRRQTSFASMDVTPFLEDVSSEVEIDEKDLRIDTYRSSGAGGQHVNKTDSAVRLTHLPTGIVVSCQNERSQHQNKAKAMQILGAKLAERARMERRAELDALSGDRVDNAWGNQIRSYVMAPYQLVKDLRTNYETGNVDAVLDGDLDAFMEAELRRQREGTRSGAARSTRPCGADGTPRRRRIDASAHTRSSPGATRDVMRRVRRALLRAAVDVPCGVARATGRVDGRRPLRWRALDLRGTRSRRTRRSTAPRSRRGRQVGARRHTVHVALEGAGSARRRRDGLDCARPWAQPGAPDRSPTVGAAVHAAADAVDDRPRHVGCSAASGGERARAARRRLRRRRRIADGGVAAMAERTVHRRRGVARGRGAGGRGCWIGDRHARRSPSEGPTSTDDVRAHERLRAASRGGVRRSTGGVSPSRTADRAPGAGHARTWRPRPAL